MLKLRCAWCGSDNLKVTDKEFGICEEIGKEFKCIECGKITNAVYVLKKCFPKINYVEFLKFYNREEIIK